MIIQNSFSPRLFNAIWGSMILLSFVPGSPLAAAEKQPAIRFNRDIRPILSDTCFHCHGPDAARRKAGLRMDQSASVLSTDKGPAAIVPGKPEESEMVRRITSTNPDDHMPPPESGRSLTPQQIELLRRWVQEGARYENHWSFVPPTRPPLPKVKNQRWPRNAIDYFVLERLEAEGLKPSPEADKRRLLRRVTLDLTGLPPTPIEIDQFLADRSPLAYDRVVERLLKSPRYGERMALPWLDAARFADTMGYLFDTEQIQWAWRDWVIGAFNANLPFDQFTLSQLAGDLLPGSTHEQQIASGFNRNHIINTEAGAIAPEYLVENVFDRVETTSTVWMGLTVQCARCHDHKYDPITQKEYYQLYAFFNSVAEQGLAEINKNAPPLLKAPTPEHEIRQKKLRGEVERLEALMKTEEPAIASAQSAWESTFAVRPEPVLQKLLAQWPLDGTPVEAASKKGSVEGGSAMFDSGFFGQAIVFDGKNFLNAGSFTNFAASGSLTYSAWIRPESHVGQQPIFSRMEAADQNYRGMVVQLTEGSLTFALVHRFPDDQLRVSSKGRVLGQRWQHVAVTYDGSGKSAGCKLYINGLLQEFELVQDSLKGPVATERPLLIGNGQPGIFFKGRIDEGRIYSGVLSAEEIGRLPGNSIHTLLTIEPEQRSPENKRRVRDHFLTQQAPVAWKEPYLQLQKTRSEQGTLEESIPTVMVMREMEKGRDTFVLTRGAYDKPTEKVSAGTPGALPPMPEKYPRTRLGLAQWLVDPTHPLTARVTVNRFWQMYFGLGLVRTSEDFGQQSEWPSHPELLDWLATEFVGNGWDVKSIQRLIVTSATYRQSSGASAALFERDPENRLLARGPRIRLDAELIRDQAMAASGLLVDRIGGPSVRPYEPADLWKEVAFDTTGKVLTGQIYIQDHAESLYRRGIYTFWKRTSPPATLQIFDAPDRERCVVRRDRTNTPQQALVTMNDPTYVEVSRKLAERMLRDGGNTPAERISHGFMLLATRKPSKQELAPLVAMVDRQNKRFLREPGIAESLLHVGESSRDPAFSPAELAAYTVIANILLNLDEVLTKG